MTGIFDDMPPQEIKPRNLNIDARCPDCKSEDPLGGAAMFHPAHKWGPCIVVEHGGVRCPCTKHEQQTTGAT
jgi:hypothetical protein